MEIKNRNIAVAIILSVVTCGIYGIYWFVKITDETNALASTGQTASGGMAFLFTLLSCGIYGYYWAYMLGQKNSDIKGDGSNDAVLFLLLQIFGLGIVNYALVQTTLNANATVQ